MARPCGGRIPWTQSRGHGFISSQRMGMSVFESIDRDAPLVVAEAVWQYSHHVLAGLRRHRGPILTVANWSGEWPGLVGMLNINASLTKMGRPYSTIWGEDLTDPFADEAIRRWVETGTIEHDTSHVRDLDPGALPGRRGGPRPAARRRARRAHGDPRRLRRGLHGHVQRDHR